MSGGIFGFLELFFFYGLALGIALWQYISVSRELNKTRAERLEREAREAREAEEAAERGGEPPAG